MRRRRRSVTTHRHPTLPLPLLLPVLPPLERLVDLARDEEADDVARHDQHGRRHKRRSDRRLEQPQWPHVVERCDDHRQADDGAERRDEGEGRVALVGLLVGQLIVEQGTSGHEQQVVAHVGRSEADEDGDDEQGGGRAVRGEGRQADEGEEVSSEDDGQQADDTAQVEDEEEGAASAQPRRARVAGVAAHGLQEEAEQRVDEPHGVGHGVADAQRQQVGDQQTLTDRPADLDGGGGQAEAEDLPLSEGGQLRGVRGGGGGGLVGVGGVRVRGGVAGVGGGGEGGRGGGGGVGGEEGRVVVVARGVGLGVVEVALVVRRVGSGAMEGGRGGGRERRVSGERGHGEGGSGGGTAQLRVNG